MAVAEKKSSNPQFILFNDDRWRTAPPTSQLLFNSLHPPSSPKAFCPAVVTRSPNVDVKTKVAPYSM